MSWFSRLFRRRAPPAPVSLDLHQQLALLALARFGPLSFNRLFEEVAAVRPTTQAEMANAVLSMEAAAVIARHAEPTTSRAQRRYALTRRGRRILRYIPAEPRSAIEFYV